MRENREGDRDREGGKGERDGQKKRESILSSKTTAEYSQIKSIDIVL